MKRRQLLQLGAGLSVGALTGVRAWAKPANRFVIVGGGIVGASICYQLARRGADVTLLEKTAPAAGASGKSFAWINAGISKQPHHYHTLSRLGVHAYRTLQQDLGAELPLRWGGTTEWYANPLRAEELQRLTRQQQQWGYPVRFIDEPEMARSEPRLLPGKTIAAAFSELEGSIDSAAATHLLLRRAQAAGATVHYPCAVTAIALNGKRGVTLETTQGPYHCDSVVLAGGVHSAELAAMAGVQVPLKPAPGIVVRTTPQPQSINSVLVTEDAHMRQQADGRFVLGDDFDPPATEIHKQLASQPLDFPDPSYAAIHGQRIRGQAARYLPSLATAEIDTVSLCWRPMPKDGFPVVGFAGSVPQVYVAVMHSGVTLAPLVGELAALELLDGVAIDLLEFYRPGRFV